MERIIFHIDVNNAFLSWTAVDMLRNGSNIDIREIPAVIAGDEESRHGIVIAKSPVAKKRGVVTAEPLYMARRKCPGLKVFPSNRELYKRESDKLYQYFCTLTPTVERFSIDECFLDFTGTSYLYDDYMKLAENIRTYVNQHFGITINIGIAHNKLCAKMASDFEKPNRIHTLFPSEIETKMWPLPVRDLFMVGKKSSEILYKLGIYTIGQLAHSDSFLLAKYFKSQAIKMIEAANGIDDDLVAKTTVKERSISVSDTLAEDAVGLDTLKEVLLYQADRVGRNARKEGVYAQCIAIILKNHEFVTYSHQKKIINPTNATEEIYKVACEILENTWRRDPIRLIGIRLSSFTSCNQRQVSLFEKESEIHIDKLQTVVDDINDKYGKLKIMPASMKKRN